MNQPRDFEALDRRRRALGLSLRDWAALADVSESVVYHLSQNAPGARRQMGELAEIKLTRALDVFERVMTAR